MFKRPYLYLVVAIVAFANLPQPALAGGVAGSFAASIGVGFPSSTNAQNIGGSSQPSLGLDYRFPSATPHVNPLSAYFDYRTGSNGGLHLSDYGLGVGYSNESVSKIATQPYVGVGLGFYTATASFNFALPSNPPSFSVVSQSQTSLGGKFFGGLDFAQGVGVEASYEITPRVSDVNTDAFVLRFRYRFG